MHNSFEFGTHIRPHDWKHGLWPMSVVGVSRMIVSRHIRLLVEITVTVAYIGLLLVEAYPELVVKVTLGKRELP